MSDQDNENKGFVIKDKRRFDSSGNEKSEESATEKPPVKSSADIKNEAAADNSGHSEAQEMNFSSFVMSLATQALMQLGEIAPPPGINLEIDKAAARQSIDILGMLQQKTKNNLDKDEEHLLEQILHNLRLSYVKAVS